MDNRISKYTDVLALAVIIIAMIAIIITIILVIIVLYLAVTGQITAISAESHAKIAKCTSAAARDLARYLQGRI